MTREELKEHCKKQIESCEMWAAYKGQEPHGKIYEEHKLILELLEQEPTTKNDLGVDCVARQDVERYIEGFINEYTSTEELEFINLELDGLKHIPSVTQEPILDNVITVSRRTHNATHYGEELRRALQIIDKYKAESEE